MRYHLPYTGSYNSIRSVMLPADNFAVQLPKSMTFIAGAGIDFQQVHPPNRPRRADLPVEERATREAD